MEIDYQVGSLSDLITGSTTPNKVKVVKKKVELPEKVTESPAKPEKKRAKENSPAKPEKFEKKQNAYRPKVEILKVGNVQNIYENDDVTETSTQRKEKREKAKKLKAIYEEKKELRENSEEATRTVFVGNVPLKVNKTRLKRFFMKYGRVESVRFRCAPIKTLNTPKKVSVIKGEFHPDRKSWVSFVKFETVADAKNALKANGEIFKDHHLRVALCRSNEKPDESKAIFVGNLPLKAEDDQLWQVFEPCGKIESVRIVRDKLTGMGKGFAFVNFASSDSVQLALESNSFKIDNMELRIQHCNAKEAKKNKKNNISKSIKQKKIRTRELQENSQDDSGDKQIEKRKKKSEKSSENSAESPEQDENVDKVEIKKSPRKRTAVKGKNVGESTPKRIKKTKSKDTENESKKPKKKKEQGENRFEKSIAEINHSFEGHKVDIKKKKKKNLGLLKKQKLMKKIAPIGLLKKEKIAQKS